MPIRYIFIVTTLMLASGFVGYHLNKRTDLSHDLIQNLKQYKELRISLQKFEVDHLDSEMTKLSNEQQRELTSSLVTAFAPTIDAKKWDLQKTPKKKKEKSDKRNSITSLSKVVSKLKPNQREWLPIKAPSIKFEVLQGNYSSQLTTNRGYLLDINLKLDYQKRSNRYSGMAEINMIDQSGKQRYHYKSIGTLPSFDQTSNEYLIPMEKNYLLYLVVKKEVLKGIRIVKKKNDSERVIFSINNMISR